jgi:hypothetical protein
MFTKAAIIELHSATHDRLDVLLRHIATVPDNLQRAPVAGFGFPTVWTSLETNFSARAVAIYIPALSHFVSGVARPPRHAGNSARIFWNPFGNLFRTGRWPESEKSKAQPRVVCVLQAKIVGEGDMSGFA